MPIFNKETNEQITEQLVNKWSWMMESIEDKDQRTNTAILLENTYDKMVELGQIPSDWLDKVLNEEEELNEAPVTSSAVGTNLIPRVMFPMIRRVFPNLIANQLVSVQPITAPTGVIYYINYTYSDSKGEITAGDEYSGNFLNHDNFTANNGPGFARFYSANRLGVVVGTPDTTQIVDAGAIKNLGAFFKWNSKADIDADITGIEAFVKGRGISLSFATFYDSTNATDTAPTMSTDVALVYNTTTGNSTIYFNQASTEPLQSLAGAGAEIMIYILYNQEGSAKLPEMQFNIGSDTVNTVERKLKVRWTKESEQDMKAYHKIDVESELVKVASMEMNYEVDREVIQFIDQNVIPELKFQHDWQGDAANTTGSYDHTKNNTQGNYLDRHRALAQKIYQASSVVAQYNRIGACSWAVVSPQVGALLTMLPDFKGQISGNDMKVFEAGMLATGLKVYVDPNRGVAPAPTVAALAPGASPAFAPTDDDILMGYKSTNMTYGAGVVYSPYTTWMSNTIFDPDNFNAIRGFFNRYALKLVPRGEYYYSKIYLQNYTL
jgi:hypothetical protein